jgi:hypothetical protein
MFADSIQIDVQCYFYNQTMAQVRYCRGSLLWRHPQIAVMRMRLVLPRRVVMPARDSLYGVSSLIPFCLEDAVQYEDRWLILPMSMTLLASVRYGGVDEAMVTVRLLQVTFGESRRLICREFLLLDSWGQQETLPAKGSSHSFCVSAGKMGPRKQTRSVTTDGPSELLQHNPFRTPGSFSSMNAGLLCFCFVLL